MTPKNILPVTTVKRNLLKLLRKVESDGDTLIITREGKAAGVLLSPEEYEGLMETLEILLRAVCPIAKHQPAYACITNIIFRQAIQDLY